MGSARARRVREGHAVSGELVDGPDLVLGCVVLDADNQMTGAVTGSRLAGSASAGLVCPIPPDEETFVQLQIRFDTGAALQLQGPVVRRCGPSPSDLRARRASRRGWLGNSGEAAKR